MSTSNFVPPQGTQIDEDAGENLVNLAPADEFDPRHREAVEGLLWLGHLTDTFELYGHRFTLRTITRGERMAAAMVAREYEDTIAAGLALETATVAASILMVDNRPFNPTLTPEQPAITRVQSNFELVSEWHDLVIEWLWNYYNSLRIREAQAFNELESK